MALQRAAILDLNDVLRLPLLSNTERTLGTRLPLLFGSFQTIAGVTRHKDPKWRRAGNLKVINFSIYCHY